LIEFPEGVLGFPDESHYALLAISDEGNFFWLQSVSRPEVAFVVCDPCLFVPDYEVPAKPEEFSQIGLEDMSQAQVFIVINKVTHALTGNLQGPLVVNAANRRARQLVLSEKKYSTRHPLMQLDEARQHASLTA